MPWAGSALVDLEVDEDVEIDFDGFAVLHGGPEFVLPDGLDRFLVETHPYTTDGANVGGIAVLIDPAINLDVAGHLPFSAGFFGKLRLHRGNDHRRTD